MGGYVREGWVAKFDREGGYVRGGWVAKRQRSGFESRHLSKIINVRREQRGVAGKFYRSTKSIKNYSEHWQLDGRVVMIDEKTEGGREDFWDWRMCLKIDDYLKT